MTVKIIDEGDEIKRAPHCEVDHHPLDCPFLREIKPQEYECVFGCGRKLTDYKILDR